MKKPSVSVIIPTYNRAKYLARSVNSVLGQTYQDFEIIIVDDASTDNTENIVKTLQDPRITYLKHGKNQGGAAARNTGIKAARADLVAFQDSDDEWLPNKLDKQMQLLTETPPKVGVVYTGFCRIRGDETEYIPAPKHQTLEGNIYQELLKWNFITTQAAVVKKECFQKAGMFDETLPRFQDWDLFLRIAKCYEFRYVPEPMVTAYYTEGSISSNQKALRKALEIFIQKYEEDYKKDKKLYSSKLVSLSCSYLTEDDLINSRKYLFKAFKTSKRPGLLIALLVSFFGTSAAKQYWSFMGANFDL